MASKLVQQEIKPLFLNTDADIRDVGAGESIYNMGLETIVVNGSLVKVNGNILIPINFIVGGQTVTSLPAGTNVCIGVGEDVQNQCLLYHIYNSNSNHCILQYTPSTNAIVAVLYAQPILNYQLSNKIRNTSIQDGIAFWTDGYDGTSATVFNDNSFNTERGGLIIADAISYTQGAVQFADNNFDAGNVLLVGFTSTAGFLAGQRIRVQQYPGFVNASYNVECTIVSVTATTILTDIPFGLSSPPNGGLIILLPTTGYDHIDLQTIDGIRFPPITTPTAVYATDTAYAKNFFQITEKLCQFQYCWQYVDKTICVFSPMSMLVVPYGDETVNNQNTIDTNFVNNVIYITVQTGSSLITDITIGVRFGNTGQFGTFITLNKSDLGIANDTTYVYSFYNDRQITIADQADWVRLQDDVPQVTNKGFLVKTDDNTHKLSAQCTEGFNNVKTNIKLNYIQIDRSAILAPLTQPTKDIGNIQDLINNTESVGITLHTPIVAGSTFLYTDNTPANLLTNGVAAINFSFAYTFTSADVIDQTSFIALFLSWLNSTYGTLNATPLITWQIDNSNPLRVYTLNYPSLSLYIGINVIIYANIAKYPHFMSGAKHPLCVFYRRKEGWTGTAQVAQDGSTELSIPFPTQLANANPPSMWQNQIEMSIFHQPPIEADEYCIGYAGNNTIASQVMYSVCNINHSNDSVWTASLAPFNSYIIVNPQAKNGGSIGYNYTPGDRIRFMMQWDLVSGYQMMPPSAGQIIDVEVVAYDASTSTISFQGLGSTFLFDQTNGGNHTIVEIYTPYKQTGNPLYYELSEWLPIGNAHQANRYHTSNLSANALNQNQDPNNLSTVPAIYVLENGDCWLKLRMIIDANGDGESIYQTLCEDFNFSDFYVSNSYNKGRPNGINPYVKRASLNIVRRSQIYISGTQINGLNSYWSTDGDDWATLMPQDGIITGLEQVGYELQVYQGQKVTPILLQRTQLTNTDGSTNPVSSSTVFFGSHNPRNDDSGSLYPESIVGTGTHRYCFDVLKGRFVRVATDRNWNISMLYKKNTFTVQLAQAMRSAGTSNFNVFGYYDSGYDKVYWTIIDNRPLEIIDTSGIVPVPIPNPAFINNPYIPPITIVFCENGDKEQKGWQGDMPFHPEFWGSVGTQMITFKAGQLFIHTPNAPKNYFYNGLASDNAPCSITVVMNKNPEIVKTFYDILQYCNNLMSCPEYGDISIPPTTTYPQGMSSRLIASKWNNQEGVLSANFMKDINTPNMTLPTVILEGRDLKGEAISVKLSNPDTNPLTLNKIVIEGFVSDPIP